MRGMLLRTRKRRLALLTAALVIGSLLAVCGYWRIGSYRDFSDYLEVRHQAPVALALWRGEIRPRAEIGDVIARWRPNATLTLGPFVDITYYPGGDLRPGVISLAGTALRAKDGRLITAGSYGCTFERTYFDVTTADENALYERLVEERIKAQSADVP